MKYKKFLLISILLIGGFLRFYQIDSIPPGLYQDEVSIGNNAYAILTTGKDEFGKSFPLVFKSFGDYKMPLYIYGTAASIAIFGKNELAVRFLSAFSGTVTIFILYMLVQQLVNINKEKLSIIYRKYLPLLSAFLLAIFPWHIQFSRAGFETNVGLCLFLIGVLLTIYYVNKKDIKILNIAFFFFLLAFYTYHVYRVVIPLTLFILTCTFFYQHPKQRLQIFLLAIVSFFIALPMVFISLTGEGQTRFAQASAFSDLSTKGGLETIFMYPMIYIKNYLSYFSLYFLFYHGDGFGRHQIPNISSVYMWQLPFLLIGLYKLFSLRKTVFGIIIITLFILAPLAAAVARPSPHLLRSLLLVIPLAVTTALGIVFIFEKLKKTRVIFVTALVFIGAFSFIYYMHMYYTHYPKTNIIDWGGGYKQVVKKAESHKKDYDLVVVDKYLNLAPYYFAFYSNSITPVMVASSWEKSKMSQNKKILYIRPYYGRNTTKNLVDTVYLPTQNNDVFAQFWGL